MEDFIPLVVDDGFLLGADGGLLLGVKSGW